MKKVKTSQYFITDAFATSSRDTICIKSDSEIKEIKNSDIPIMDLQSTGSLISKYPVDKAFIKTIMTEIIDVKVVDDIKVNNEENVIYADDETYKELTIDDFINDFKI